MLRRLLSSLAVAAALVLPASRAHAQLLDAKVVSLEAAKRMIAAAEAEARKNNWNMSIAIVDATGELIAFHRMDEASPASVGISQGKARTAARFKRPTKSLDSSVTAGRTALLSFDGITLVEGGVPIIVAGKVIGAVGVSGASSAQDAQVAQAGIAALTP
jgi:glc operon protein GlcG